MTWRSAAPGPNSTIRTADVDLDADLIHIRRSWDRHEDEILAKSRAGSQRAPIVSVPRVELHQLDG